MPIDAQAAGASLPTNVTGRVASEREADGAVRYRRQWPGTYFETAFRGTRAAFRVGPGDVILHVRIDGGVPIALVKPKPGFYAVTGLAADTHRLRVDVVTEDQAAPTVFGGFRAAGSKPAPTVSRTRQIEFVGDSHTVGYGNTSPVRGCTEDQVWATTDTAAGVAAQTAARYDADYQVNAISGRGIVRNYAGGGGDTVPQAYPYVLFDKAARVADPAWHPQVIAVALGTNDFSTPLKPGERWPTRDALHVDYERTYTAFVRQLRARHPQALIVLWATDLADGEIADETRRVVDRLRSGGERRIAFVPVRGLGFTACNAHPSVADDGAVAAALSAAIDVVPGVWARTR